MGETAGPAQAIDPDQAGIAGWVERGDRAALEAIFARHADAAVRLAARRLGNLSDADDAVQHAFIGFMAGAARIRPGEGSVRAYILASVVNACAQLRRADTSRRARESLPTPIDRPDRDRDTADALREALAQLPEHQRRPIELRYLAGLDFPEIASALGRNERTVRGQVTRGLEELRRVGGRLGLAGSATALALALAALPGPSSAAEIVARCVAVARRGPRARRLPPWRLVGAGAAVAAILAVAASIALAPHARPVPLPARTEAPSTAAVASPSAPSADAAVVERRPSRVAWSLRDDATAADLPFLALGAARAVDDPAGVGVAWWDEAPTRADWWSPPSTARPIRAQWRPERLLRAPRLGEDCWLICIAPPGQGDVEFGLVADAVRRTADGWRVELDGVRAARAPFGGRLLVSRVACVVPLGRLGPADRRIAVEVRWREHSTTTAVSRDGSAAEQRVDLAIRTPSGDAPLTLAATPPPATQPAPAAAGGSASAGGWWQRVLLPTVTEGPGDDATGGIVGTSTAWPNLARGWPAPAGTAVRILGPRLARDEGITLRSIRWDGATATITIALWLRSDLPATVERRRPLLPAWIERPPGMTGPATILVAWERFVAADASGTYARDDRAPAPPGVNRLDGFDLPRPDLPQPTTP